MTQELKKQIKVTVDKYTSDNIILTVDVLNEALKEIFDLGTSVPEEDKDSKELESLGKLFCKLLKIKYYNRI